ncbi:PLP-dependent transferase [Methylorubrum extorquens]|uniref:PLP-dependent transferase n=1 Tax=Methylorubrum extorquens TaxID=408 RepID=UPI0002EC3FAC|nr:PLP-dependent transferase [Methylorubrum extorquens]
MLERRPRRTEGRCGRTRPRLGSGGLRAEASKLFDGVAKLGDARSRAIQPASTTYSHLTPIEPRAVGVTDGSVRLAVGLANIDEIRTDLDRALAAGRNDGVWRNPRHSTGSGIRSQATVGRRPVPGARGEKCGTRLAKRRSLDNYRVETMTYRK